MAKSTPAPKKAKPAAKTPIFKTDIAKVNDAHMHSVCVPIKKGFVIFDQEEGKPLHSGIAKSELDAWKLAAHNL